MIVSPGFVLPSGVSVQGKAGMITQNFNTSGTIGTAILDSGTGVTLLIRGGTAATYQPVSNILFKSGPLSSWFTAGTAWAGVYCGNQAWYTAFDHCDFTCYAIAGFVTDANFNNITLTNCFFGYNGTLGATAITGGLLVGYFTATASAALNCTSCLFYQNYGVGAGGYVPGSVGAYGVNFFGCQFAGSRATSFATWSGYNLLAIGGGNGITIVDGCWFENAAVGDLYLYTGPCVAIGCSFNSNGSGSQINNAQSTSYLTLLGCFTSVSSGSTIPYMVTNVGGVVNWMGIQMPYSGGTLLASGGPSQAQLAGTGTIGGTTYSPGSVTPSTTVTVTSNAGTVPITASVAKFVNSSAATMAITMATTGAVDGQSTTVKVYDFSGVGQTITWVNTENSTVSVPTTSNGSTTLPKTVTFQFNGATSKWRCIQSV
jgi:hypothetical protein